MRYYLSILLVATLALSGCGTDELMIASQAPLMSSSSIAPVVSQPPVSEAPPSSSSIPEPPPPPAVEISFSHEEIALGETLVIVVENSGDKVISAQTDLTAVPQFFASDDDTQIALLPISYLLSEGAYNLTITVGDEVFDNTIDVVSREFEVQYLTMSADIDAATNTAQANEEWTNAIEPLKLISDPVQYWEGEFLQPAQGIITTEFGVIRYTNDNPTPTRHSGIDIAAPIGTEIIAPNHGRVLYADFLQLTGYTLVIEHGYGLKSFYYHLDSITVAEGDMVEKGQLVATMGTTGYSTGSHLHYAMLVNKVFTNPWSAFDFGYQTAVASDDSTEEETSSSAVATE